MQKGIIGKKLGMTQLFDENGKVVPVTVIEAGPCTVVQKKTVESDGYEAVQLALAKWAPREVSKATKGRFDKADVARSAPFEFRLDDISGMNVGDILKADVFAAGDRSTSSAPAKVRLSGVITALWPAPPPARATAPAPLPAMPALTAPPPPRPACSRASVCPATWALCA